MTIDLRMAAIDYLHSRRARGFQSADHGWLIASFLDRMEAAGATVITAADAVAFAQEPAGTQRIWHAQRLSVIRGFAAYVHMLDPSAAELIPAGLIYARVTRPVPYLYSPAQIETLIEIAARLAPPMLAASMYTMIGLIAVTGMRSGEALAVDLDDVSFDHAVITVTGKNNKLRLVPLHTTTVEALESYLQRRAELTTTTPTGPLFVGKEGGRLNACTARAAFRAVVNSCDLPARPSCNPPRLHDLRHTFAVNTLIDAHRAGVDIDARIAVLATFLGHVEPINSYWYLTASAELMHLVSDRMTAYHKRGRQ